MFDEIVDELRGEIIDFSEDDDSSVNDLDEQEADMDNDEYEYTENDEW